MPDTLQEYTFHYKNGTTITYYGHLNENQLNNFNTDSLEETTHIYPVKYIKSDNNSNNNENDFIGKLFLALIFTGFFLYIFFQKKMSLLFDKAKTKIYNYYYKNELPIVKEVLEKYLPFYQTLNEGEKNKFNSRVLRFKNKMTFEYNNDWPDTDKIAYFVSASAIQLTFGLEIYTFSHFNTIVIHPENYYLNSDFHSVQGHVHNGYIHFSWKDFKEGYEHPHNKQNVGLHEMAHALSFECFNVGDEGDYFFKNEFANFSKVARPIYEKLQYLPNNILGSYATTNYHEFWAVCVEVYFEQPQQLCNEIPELYNAISKLLKQDLL